MALSISTPFTEELAIGPNSIGSSRYALIYHPSATSTERCLIPANDQSTNPYRRLLIMIKSGVRPTPEDFRTNFVQHFYHATNTLVAWNGNSSSFNNMKNSGIFSASASGDGVIIKTTDRTFFPLVQGIRTGTATWFAVCCVGTSDGKSGNSSDLDNFVLGDVGEPGSGNDIEITNTSIVGSSESNLYGLAADLEINLTHL